VDTTAIAWAMAASVLIVAGAVYATSELLAHQHNALLLKPGTSARMAVRLAAMLGETSDTSAMRETARGQAFEVFGLRRFVDQHLRLYENLVGGAGVSEGITDTAIVA
jgi:hypothetical protein